MITAMINYGIDPPAELLDDGKVHRWKGAGDKSKKNWYILFTDGEFQAGTFGRWVGDFNGAQKWCSKSDYAMSDAEKALWKKRQADIQRQVAEAKLAEQAECAAWCTAAWGKYPDATDDHPYLVRKGVKAHGLKLIGDSLMVPLCKSGVGIVGMQFISPDGEKKFKTGSANIGAVHAIGKEFIDNTVIICEGYATGATIHEVTGHRVMVAFVAGNLKQVSEAIRLARPYMNIIIAADNDAWAKDPHGEMVKVPCEINGVKRVNTGIKKAEEAVKSIITPDGPASFVFPTFEDSSTYPTDYNDLCKLEGPEAVEFSIFPPPMAEYTGLAPAEDAPKVMIDEEGKRTRPNVFDGAPFKLLGYDHNVFYYLGNDAGQVLAMAPREHTKSNLFTLAPVTWWECKFPGRTSFDEDAAKNALLQTGLQVGVYDDDRLRGLGAWEDDSRSVLHMGKELLVDNRTVPLQQFKSRYIYEKSLSIADVKMAPALSKTEANKVLTLCKMLSWDDPINAWLLAGWCVGSIICGSLKWRPHIWLTGPSGAGKSWIITNIIKLLGGLHLKGMLGTTSEAGLRRRLANHSYSVFFDEFEAEDRNAAARIQSVLEYARPSSCNEDSKIYKAKQGGSGVDAYQPRSCIGLASVNVSMSQKADKTRVSVLSLVNGPQEHFDNVIAPYWSEHIRPPEYGAGFRSRAIKMLPVINKNVDPFQEAVTKQMKSRRQGDQFGTLLALAYSLTSDGLATKEQADAFVAQHKWDSHTSEKNEDDECRCLRVILEHVIRIDGSGREMTVAELILFVADKEMNKEVRKDYWERLRRVGIIVHKSNQYFQVAADHTALVRILKDTPWGNNWHRILLRVKDAVAGRALFTKTEVTANLPIATLGATNTGWEEADEFLD